MPEYPKFPIVAPSTNQCDTCKNFYTQTLKVRFGEGYGTLTLCLECAANLRRHLPEGPDLV